MSRFNKKKFAVTLLSAMAFGANAQAHDLDKNKVVKTDSCSIESTRPAQNSGKLGQVTIGETRQIDWKTGGLFTGFSLIGLETVRSIIGAATDSPVGSCSIGRAIKNRVKKNDQLDLIKELNNVINNENWQKIEEALSKKHVGSYILCYSTKKSFHDVVFELANQLVNNYENAKSKFSEKVSSAYKEGVGYFYPNLKNLQKFKDEYFDGYLKALADIFSGKAKVESVVCSYCENKKKERYFMLEFRIENDRSLDLKINECEKQFRWRYSFGDNSKLDGVYDLRDNVEFSSTDLWEKIP